MRISHESSADEGDVIEINGIKAIPRRNTSDYTLLFAEREHTLKPHLRLYKGERFLDVGANVGYYTLRAASTHGNDINIIAIEPHPETYKALCRNIASNNFKNTLAINKAVCDKKGSVTLYEEVDKEGYVNPESSTIISSLHSCSTNYKSFKVECNTLDNILKEKFIDKVDLVKMDIEGAEVKALKGATETLRKLRKIVVEIHENNLDFVKSILYNAGFDIEIAVGTSTSYYITAYVIGTKKRS